jgi:lipopolysaccharide transport system ATP-binding protein
VEKFIDTPVKRYSSGMMVRLAFAVAAHIEPEILIIDEVLAVGDSAFQKKCLGKVSEVACEGRTILFVSHQAAAVENLCRRGIVLDSGRVAFDGTQTEALGFYADSFGHHTGLLQGRSDRKGSGAVQVTAVEFRNTDGERVNAVASGQDVDIYFYYENRTQSSWPDLKIYIDLKNQFDIPVFRHGNLYTGENVGKSMPEKGALVCRLRKLPLPVGSYRLDYAIRTQGHRSILMDQMDAAIDLHVEGGDFFGTGQVPSPQHGACLVDGHWRLDPGVTPAASAAESIAPLTPATLASTRPIAS